MAAAHPEPARFRQQLQRPPEFGRIDRDTPGGSKKAMELALAAVRDAFPSLDEGGRRVALHALDSADCAVALPVYVALEQIDPRLLEAAKDLYASPLQAFLRVTLPLSAPGIVAGTLLTFIPAAGDFINAQLLGTPKQHMIGNVIQSKFLELIDYPAAAALSSPAAMFSTR